MSRTSIGRNEIDHGFIRIFLEGEEYIHQWVCDEFQVEKYKKDNQIAFRLIFKTEKGKVVFDGWEMRDLWVLSMEMNGGSILWRELISIGVRCCPSREATVAILNIIQKPELKSGPNELY